jgi:putative transposase
VNPLAFRRRLQEACDTIRAVREYRRSAHTVYALHYHFVFITKYRKPVLRGDIGQEVRDLIREICRSEDIEILQGHVRPDHIHLLLSVPPHMAPSRVMQAIKGKTSHHLLQDRRKLRAEFWGRHLWARGYFVCTTGNVTDEMITRYIEQQGAVPQDDDRFHVTED